MTASFVHADEWLKLSPSVRKAKGKLGKTKSTFKAAITRNNEPRCIAVYLENLTG
jgi:hypothetical protein